MTTLVIHPQDSTTKFLSEIYFDKGWTVINTNTSKKILKQQIKAHDRIVMLGHGTKYGLIGYKKLVIDSSWVYLLREKECVCVWCNADEFVLKYGLTGLYTGMIISERDEAEMYSVDSGWMEIIESNVLFANALRRFIDSDNAVDKILGAYFGDTGVIRFNREGIYFKNKS